MDKQYKILFEKVLKELKEAQRGHKLGYSVSIEDLELNEPKPKKANRNSMSELLLEEKENKKEEARSKRHEEKLSLQREFLAQLKNITDLNRNYPEGDSSEFSG